MAKTFASGDVLAAADLNTNMVQPNTAGTGNRIVAGKTPFTISAASSATTTVSYGVTFTTLTSFVAIAQSGSNIDLVPTTQGAPTTSSASVRLAEKTGATVTVSGSIHWIAVGT